MLQPIDIITAALARMSSSELASLAAQLDPEADHLTRAITVSGGVSALARRLGVTPQAVQNWRQGIRTPRPAIAEKIRAIAVSSVSSA